MSLEMRKDSWELLQGSREERRELLAIRLLQKTFRILALSVSLARSIARSLDGAEQNRNNRELFLGMP
jgi:hypothetical protein